MSDEDEGRMSADKKGGDVVLTESLSSDPHILCLIRARDPHEYRYPRS